MDKNDMKSRVSQTAIFAKKEEEEKPKIGRPRRNDLQRGGGDDGLPEDLHRTSIVVDKESWERFKDYCYTERVTMKKALGNIINAFIDEYEKEHELKKRPEGD